MASTIEFRDYDVPVVVDTNNDHDDKIVIENNYNHIISNHQYRECILLLSKTNNNNNRSGLKNRNGGNNIDRGNLDLSWKSIMKYNSKNIVHDDVEDYGMTTEQHQIKNNELINDNNYNTRRNQRQTNKLIRSLTVMKNQWTYQCCKVVKDLFLPVGYPQSVNDGYIQYQFYDSLQGLCSYLRGVVSTSAVLTAAGVGNSDASALSAAVNWATKDGCGMIGGLLFSYVSSAYFDSHIKEFRLFADVINDVGLTIDMITPYIPTPYLLYVSIAATLCRSLCGIAAGATKGSITEHFAIHHNMADLNAKEGTQETLVSLIGMILGISIARMIQSMEKECDVLKGKSILAHSATIATWYIFTLLTLIHIWANYIGVKVLRLKSLNRQRTEFILCTIVQKASKVVQEYISKSNSDNSVLKMKLLEECHTIDIMTPKHCNESIMKSVRALIFGERIRLGIRLSHFMHDMILEEIEFLFGKVFRNESYCLNINLQGLIIVVLHLGATEEDQLKAFVHALVLKEITEGSCFKGYNVDARLQMIACSKTCVDNLFQNDILSLDRITSQGWDKKLLLGFNQYRATWEEGMKKKHD